MGSGPFWEKFPKNVVFWASPLRGAIKKKKNYQTLDIVQTWGGVSGPAKLFFEKRYGHVLRGEGGQRASSKVVFCKKVCFGVPDELLCVKII